MIKKLFLFILAINISCTYNIEKETDIFERQISENSKEVMIIGDSLDYWGNDSPKGAIFIIYSKEKYLKAFGIKIQNFEEFDKSILELEKQISTSNIYTLKLYGIKEKLNVSKYSPLICDFINDNLSSSEELFSESNISFRIKEREWVYINTKLDYEKYNLFFVRLSISQNYFGFIRNKSPEFIKILAEKKYSDINNINMKKENYITCSETIFLEEKYLSNVYLNPDIVFHFISNT